MGKQIVEPTEIDKLTNLLYSNSEKNFIKRILNPEKYPVLDWGNGVATHRMSYSEVDGKYLVYPEIIQRSNGGLQLLEEDEFVDYAIDNQEFLEFSREEDANWFTKNYKKFWDK